MNGGGLQQYRSTHSINHKQTLQLICLWSVFLFHASPVFIFSVSICTFLTRIFTAIMPMVAAGLIIDDPTLQPVRRLVSLVGTVIFWFSFELCLWNVCCGYCWGWPVSSGHVSCMAITCVSPFEVGVVCDSRRATHDARSARVKPRNSRLCHR